MNHVPTLQDAASDLYRCVYASLAKDGFESETFKLFFTNAQEILAKFDTPSALEARKLVQRSLNKSLDKAKRQEDLLTASLILKS